MPGRGKKSAGSPKAKKSEKEMGHEEIKASDAPARQTASFNAPSVQDILQDTLTKISLEHWAPGSAKKSTFKPEVVEQIYKDEISAPGATTSRLMLLELSFYLEKYVIKRLNLMITLQGGKRHSKFFFVAKA